MSYVCRGTYVVRMQRISIRQSYVLNCNYDRICPLKDVTVIFCSAFLQYWKTILKIIAKIAKFYAYSSSGISFGCVGSYIPLYRIISNPNRDKFLWLNATPRFPVRQTFIIAWIYSEVVIWFGQTVSSPFCL